MLDFGEIITGSRRVSSEQLALIREYVRKYADLLSVTVLPEVLIRDNVSSDWLGRSVWSAARPNTTTMYLQRSILNDPETLERIVAHEMAHHVQSITMTDAEIAKIKIGIRPPSHGKRFHELAYLINAATRENFVTETSDGSYAVKSKRYSMLIRKLPDGRLAYAIGVRFSPKMKKVIETTLYTGGRLIQLDEPRWTAGPRIGDSWGVPAKPEDRAKLQALFDSKAT